MTTPTLIIYSITLFLFGCLNNSSDTSTIPDGVALTVNHDVWDGLLKTYVDTNGNVDYSNFKKDSHILNEYLNHLAKNPISKTAEKEERLAYYINLYNAGTVQLILENYPLNSIRSIFRSWGKDRVFIGNKKYSLGYIEHDILRKMNEPRIHFAINCASYSCPKLLNEAFLPSKIQEQLQEATIDFVNDISRNKISSHAVELSKIFKWYKQDFTKNNSLLDYLNNYSKIRISDDSKINFLNYDWDLNERR